MTSRAAAVAPRAADCRFRGACSGRGLTERAGHLWRRRLHPDAVAERTGCATTAPASPVTGAPGSPSPAVSAPPAAAPASEAAGGTARDQELLSGGNDAKFLSDYVAPENPLQIGGQLYLRMQTTASGGQAPGAWSLDAPSLLDLYLDARPNPRVRAFILGRMSYDPTLGTNNPVPSTGQGSSNGAFTSADQPHRLFDLQQHARAGHVARPDVDPVRHPRSRVRDGRQATRPLGHRALLAADRLPAPAEAQPPRRVRRASGDDDAEAERPLGGEGVELLRVPGRRGSQRAHAEARGRGGRLPRRGGHCWRGGRRRHLSAAWAEAALRIRPIDGDLRLRRLR